ncbi:MAG: hypothetical protein H0V17_03925 [Deltaproteobacteria bacterium]|nr:hypothetical protein [Deltaproteobacteria bacterium]
MSVRARHVLCILHDASALEPIVARYPGFEIDREYSIDTPDPRMPNAFKVWMDRVDPSMTDEDWAAIEAHRAVTYVLSPPIDPPRAIEISTAALRLVSDALSAGALAVKGESAGIAHGAAKWKQLAAELSDEQPRFALYGAWVRRPLGAGGILYTCGMHLLGLPDIELPGEADVFTAVAWLDAFGGYQLIEAPQDTLGDGHTFRHDEDAERRVLRKLDCKRYPDDSFFYNPHGYWRLELARAAAKKKPIAKKPIAKKQTAKKPTAKKPTAKKLAAKTRR